MSFEDKKILLGLIPLIPLLVFRLLRPGNVPAGILRRHDLPFRSLLSDLFFLLFLGLLIIALAGPRWGFRLVSEYRQGVDLVFAVDLSRSMEVRDCDVPGGAAGRASRLERGLAIAGELAENLEGIRLAAAIGKGRGILAVPLTWDSWALLNFLEGLDTSSISGRGTNLEGLVDAAAGAFQDEFPGRRCIILVSDGESHSGSLGAALERAGRKGITLGILALGTEAGGPIPLEGSSLNGPFLSTPEGKPVISSRRGDTLRSAAEKNGGFYVDGGREDAAAALGEEVRSLMTEQGEGRGRREPRPRWSIFILGALLCLGVSRFSGFVPAGKKAAGAAALLSLFFLSSCGAQGKLLIMEGNFLSSRGMYTGAISSYRRALSYPETVPYGEYGLGIVYASMGEGRAALEKFQSAERRLLEPGPHGELLFRLRYNRGILLFEEEKFGEAAEAFRGALEIDGRRLEAKRNLELSLLYKARAERPPQGLNLPVPGREAAEDHAALFEYLRRREQEQYRNREWTEDSDPSGPDY
jgi:Ca-activated chloride channel family protein